MTRRRRRACRWPRARASAGRCRPEGGGGSAERHANADLLRPLVDRIRDHAVDSERGQNQREHREAAEQQAPRSAAARPPYRRAACSVRKSLPGRFGAIGSSAARTAGASCAGRQRRADDQVHRSDVVALPQRAGTSRLPAPCSSARCRTSPTTPTTRRSPHGADDLAERVLAGEQRARHGLVDQDHGLGCRACRAAAMSRPARSGMPIAPI